MGWIFLLILIAWPVAEIAVFLQVGDAIGFLATILLFLAAGALGLILLRAEGLSLLIRAQQQIDRGVVPVREGFDALCLVIGGVLLVIPGFVTDILALLLILPPVRSWLRRVIVRWVVARERRAHTGSGLVIEGDYEDVTRRRNGRLDEPSIEPPGEPPGEIVHRRD